MPVDYSTLDDETLMGMIASADADALGTLYDRYGRLVFSLAIASVGDAGTAEEITQDVFTSVWQNAASYRGHVAKVRTWISSIARHRAIDVLRRAGARPVEWPVDWAEADQSFVPSVEGPDGLVELAMTQQRVRSALEALPDEQRQVLALAYLEGYSQQQIAERLGQPLGTVKTRVRLGMQKLRDMLKFETALR